MCSMELAHSGLTDLRNVRIAILVAAVALTALLFAMDPVAAWPTTNMPTAGGGSSAWWYETSNSDPLTTWVYFKYA